MAKVKKKKAKRIFLVLMSCLAIVTCVYYNIFSTLKEVNNKKHEKKELSVELENLKEKGSALKVEVNKLKDPEYVAKYAREKYLYSGKNEYIIRIE